MGIFFFLFHEQKKKVFGSPGNEHPSDGVLCKVSSIFPSPKASRTETKVSSSLLFYSDSLLSFIRFSFPFSTLLFLISSPLFLCASLFYSTSLLILFFSPLFSSLLHSCLLILLLLFSSKTKKKTTFILFFSFLREVLL